MDLEFLDILYLHGGRSVTLALIGTGLLGACSGLIGSFITLRKRTLVSDAAAHATLPGLCVGFFLAYYLGYEGGKFLPALLLGAFSGGALSIACIRFIRKHSVLSQDTAIACTLGLFYSSGIVLLSIIQRLENAAQAGLEGFLLGQVTGLSSTDIIMIASICAAVFIICLLLKKDLQLLCFDTPFADTIGRPTKMTDRVLNILALVVLCAGLKMVGLILILALLIIPPTAARLLTDRFNLLLFLSTLIGLAGAYIGASLSANIDDLPTGGAIVLSLSAIFIISLIFYAAKSAFFITTRTSTPAERPA